MFEIKISENMDTEAFLENIQFSKGDTFFKRAAESMTTIFNIKQFLENRMSSGLDGQINSLSKRTSQYDDAPWNVIVEEMVPVSVGFDTNIYMLTEFLKDNVVSMFVGYKAFYKTMDIELNKFIGDKSHRLRELTFADVQELKDELKTKSLEFNTLINMKPHNLNKSTIKDLVINSDGYADSVDNCNGILSEIRESEYEEFVEMNRRLDAKLKVIYELLHVEEVDYTKNAIKELSEHVECIASYSTMIGKMILATYESSFILLNIEKVIKEIK